ncbi:hypothetical protein [Mucisphaera sp.]|uniref:hypothetical protein n=1 Tax=Mucisphaera sp. TaxID=2913024 RepID=UPI003D0E4EF2
MFKFFRKYQTYIVVVGIVLLMIAFLLQDTLSMFTATTPSAIVIGTVDGRELTAGDENIALREMQILSAVSPVFQTLTGPANDRENARRWLLLGIAANQLGIEVSQAETFNAMAAFGLDEATVAQLAQRMNMKRSEVQVTFARWLARERAIALLLGRSHLDIELDPSPGLRRISAQIQGLMAQQAGQQAMANGDMGTADARLREASIFLGIANGAQRISRPLIEQVLSDQQSEINASMVLLQPDRLGIEAEPSEDLIQELFETYKDDDPGDGEPYGFGYKFLDRVRVESLTIPFDAVFAQTSVEEADAVAFYRDNPDFFRVVNPAQELGDEPAPPRDYREVRQEIIGYLRQQAALDRVRAIARAASAILTTELRAVPQREGYYDFPNTFEPTSLREVAQQIELDHGIRPTVRAAPNNWSAVRDLAFDPVIGPAFIADRPQRIPATDYIASIRELNPPIDNPLLAMYLQTNVPTALLSLPNGSMMILRVVDASPARIPDSLDEVRDQVVADARQLANYRELASRIETWQQRATDQTLDDLAQTAAAAVIDTGPFSRRTRDRTGLFAVPILPGIGQEPQLVDAIFDTARTLREQNAIEELNPGERTIVQPLPNELALAVVRIDSYSPINRSRFEAMLQDPTLELLVNDAMLDGNEPRPLNLETLQLAVGFTPADDEDPFASEPTQTTSTTTESPEDTES